MRRGEKNMTNQITLSADMKNAYVTKSFMKNALVYGTDEYKLLKAFKNENPDIEVSVRTIAKNPNKTTYKNLTYSNMISYIETLNNSKDLLEEFEIVKSCSVIAKNKYRYILNWFQSTCFESVADFNEFRKLISLESKENKELYA